MRKLFRAFFFAPSIVVWATTLSAFFHAVGVRFVMLLHEAVPWTDTFVPRLVSHLQPVRKILMSATALNGRQLGGVNVRGFLGRPTVETLIR